MSKKHKRSKRRKPNRYYTGQAEPMPAGTVLYKWGTRNRTKLLTPDESEEVADTITEWIHQTAALSVTTYLGVKKAADLQPDEDGLDGTLWEMSLGSKEPLPEEAVKEFYLLPDYLHLCASMEEAQNDPGAEMRAVFCEWHPTNDLAQAVLEAVAGPHRVGDVIRLMAGSEAVA